MKKKIIYFLIALFIMQAIAVVNWSLCRGFDDHMRYSAFDLELRLIEGIHNDTGQQLWIVRAFHNKLVGTAFDIFGAYLQFWKLPFLANVISLAGVVGLVAGFYYFLSGKKKTLLLWLFFGLLLLAPFIEILFSAKFPFLFRFYVIAVAYVAWSMWGYWNLLQEKRLNSKWIIILLLVSLWYQLTLVIMGEFCGV